MRVLIRNTEEREGARGPYTNVTFTDGETDASANVWKRLDQFPYKGKVVDMRLSTKNGFLNIGDVEEVENADISLFVPKAPINEKEWLQMVFTYISSIKDENIRMVTEKIVKDNADGFMNWSAAKSVHHNYLSGLLFHVGRMIVAAVSLAEVYKLNRDILIAGTILHDIGKLRELEMDGIGTSSYSVEGNLFGHLFIGAEMVDDACRELHVDTKDAGIMHLKHCILSHHNNPEFGAVKRPSTPESYLLSMVDDMDSKLWVFEQALGNLKEGECSAPNHFLNNAVVYKV